MTVICLFIITKIYNFQDCYLPENGRYNHQTNIYCEVFMESKNQLVMLMEKYQVENILRVNEYTEKFGLTLSMEDARVLAKSKNETLKEEQRVELGESILPKIILCFCDSNYIDQNNFIIYVILCYDIH